MESGVLFITETWPLVLWRGFCEGKAWYREMSMLRFPELSTLDFWTGVQETQFPPMVPENPHSPLHLGSCVSENWSL